MEGEDPGEVPPPPSPPRPAAAAAPATAPAYTGAGGGKKRVTTRAGTGRAGMAAMVGAAEAVGPVHGAYGLAVEEEAEDLLASHMKFMQG